jgi:hypothetical protein
MGGNSLGRFVESLKYWTQDDALEIEMIEESEEVLSFNVTRCRYAELYESLGIREIGTIFSCARDFALIEGFNPNVTLVRTQTIMEGAPYCDSATGWISRNRAIFNALCISFKMSFPNSSSILRFFRP